MTFNFTKNKNEFEATLSELKKFPFSFMGISFNKNFDLQLLMSNTKSFESERDFEIELNKLASFIFDDRTIHYNGFRGFPYIQHSSSLNREDGMGLSTNYTRYDIFLIHFIRKFSTRLKSDSYTFFDVDFIISNATRSDLYNDVPISEMPIDELLRRY